MEAWKIIISSLGGSVVLSAFIVFLLREWISTRLKKSIEHEYATKQIELKAELDGKLEGTKAAYQQVLGENQIRFSRYHAEQADAIKGLYQLLAKMEQKLRFLTNPIQMMPVDKEERKNFYIKQRQDYIESFVTCRDDFQENRIFLSEELCGQCNQLLNIAHKVYNGFTVYDDCSDYEMDAENRKERRKLQRDAWKEFDGPFSKAKEQLETEFRKALGSIEKQQREM
jgi:hypothetical protein